MDWVLVSWGVCSRLIAATYFISFCSMSTQLLALAGKNGVTPVADVMERIRGDFPSLWARMRRFPNILWFTGGSDFMLTCLWRAGALCSVGLMFGSSQPWVSTVLKLVSQACLLSVDLALDLSYPWDCLLYEAGWLNVFLPHAVPLLGGGAWELSVSALPHPLLGWLFRMLLFRVMIGFGKIKFTGHSNRDNAYIKGFLIFQPIPSIFGWLGNKLPLPFHKVALAGMFFIEIVAPFLLFFPVYNARMVAAAHFIALMVGIQVCGNFGHFNVLTIGLSTPFLFDEGSLFDEWPTGSAVSLVCFHAFCWGVLLPCSLANLPFNSWVSSGWAWWPGLDPRAMKVPLLRRFAQYLRECLVWRVSHAYGVFEARPGPTIRWVPVVQGSADAGETWRDYDYKYAASSEFSAPVFVAPHHPRLDHQLIYEALGYDVVSCANFSHSISTRNPYRFTRHTALERLLCRLLDKEHGPFVCSAFFQSNPFIDEPGHAPTRTRVVLVALQPTSWEDSKRSSTATGKQKFWKRTYVHAHCSVKKPDDGAMFRPGAPEFWLPRSPASFHPDSCIFRDSTAEGLELTRRVNDFNWNKSNNDPSKTISTWLCKKGHDKGDLDLASLWAFVEHHCNPELGTGSLESRTVRATKGFTSLAHRHRVRDAFHYIVWIALIRSQHLWFKSRPGEGVRKYCPSYFDFVLMWHYIVLQWPGKRGFYKLLCDPELLLRETEGRKYFVERAAGKSKVGGSWQYDALVFFSVFYSGHMTAHAKKARLSHAINRTRLKSEPAMAQANIDFTGTLPGFGPHATRLLNDFQTSWEERGAGENIPSITQDPNDGLSWCIVWPKK